MKRLGILTILAFLIVGCTRYTITPIQKDTKYSKYMDSSIELVSNRYGGKPFPAETREGARATAFLLKIKNKTSKNIEINWNKTLFIRGNQTDGSFMLIGQMYIERNRQKINDVIFANANFEKKIYPSHLVYGSIKDGFRNGWMGDGVLGVWLTFLIDGQEMHKKMLIEVKKKP